MLYISVTELYSAGNKCRIEMYIDRKNILMLFLHHRQRNFVLHFIIYLLVALNSIQQI